MSKVVKAANDPQKRSRERPSVKCLKYRARPVMTGSIGTVAEEPDWQKRAPGALLGQWVRLGSAAAAATPKGAIAA